ncbi:MAG: hypothetical protein L3J31_06330 [Bacteroidales bacterium]|nr:hypothetical protein [Bacteroidales bacterium]
MVDATMSRAQIGIQTNNPDASSALDIVSGNKGLLVPRVTLTSDLTNPSPVSSPATGLLVFNNGANQPVGFYYWGGATWMKLETGTGTITSWELTGNAGTTVGTNFLGTTDAEALAFNTNNIERMRILSNGQIVVDNGYTPPYSDNKFTVTANSTHDDAINGYSTSGIGVYGYSGSGYSIHGNSWSTVSVYARSQAGGGTGLVAAGNNVAGVYPTGGAGASFIGGPYGTYSIAVNEDGTGIAASGNNATMSTIVGGSGGAFSGTKYGIFSSTENTTNGIGIGAIGNGGGTLYVPSTGAGAAFTGNDGVFGKGTNTTDGIGIIGVGNNYNTYNTTMTGTGGAFSGFDGIYGHASTSDGIGVIGLGNNGATYNTLADGTGTGGAFTGYHGLYGHAVNTTEGTGVVGVGNDGTNYHTLTNGSGGAFSGYNGLYGYAENATGNGVVGLGNNNSVLYTFSSGSGGAFTGATNGIAGFGTTAGGSTYGVWGEYTGGGNNDGIGVYGKAWPNSGWGYGVIGQGRYYGVFSSGNFGASGSKSFVIDHPIDPENKILKHYTIESPEVLNMYRGNVLLDENGEAVVTLPDYFLFININFSYALTPIGQQAPYLFVKEEIDDEGRFIISGGNPDQKISWVVYAERNDLYMQRERKTNPEMVEIEKKPNERGKYLVPDLYGQPPVKGFFYMGKSIVAKTPSKHKIQSNKTNSTKMINELKTTNSKAEQIEEIKDK